VFAKIYVSLCLPQGRFQTERNAKICLPFGQKDKPNPISSFKEYLCPNLGRIDAKAGSSWALPKNGLKLFGIGRRKTDTWQPS